MMDLPKGATGGWSNRAWLVHIVEDDGHPGWFLVLGSERPRFGVNAGGASRFILKSEALEAERIGRKWLDDDVETTISYYEVGRYWGKVPEPKSAAENTPPE